MEFTCPPNALDAILHVVIALGIYSHEPYRSSGITLRKATHYFPCISINTRSMEKAESSIKLLTHVPSCFMWQ